MSSATAIQILPLWVQVLLSLAPAIGTVAAAAGLALTVVQSRKTNLITRAGLVAACLKTFSEDEEIQDAFYDLEYGAFAYSEEFHNTPQERKIDKLLRHLSNLALAWQAKLLTISDVSPVKYYVLRVVRNEEIAKYLAFMDGWAKEAEVGEHPYAVLSALCDALENQSVE